MKLLNDYQQRLNSSPLASRLMDLKALASAQKMGTFYDFVASELRIPRDAAKVLVCSSMYSETESVIDELLFKIRSYKSGLILPSSRV